jgi:DNA repair protein RadC
MDRSSPLITIEDMLPHLKFIRSKRQEYVLCLSLDSGHHLIARRIVTIGTLTSSLIHPREIFAAPLKDRAASVVIAHNHPSGDTNPSKADIAATQQLVAAGQILGVTMRDHLIVTKQDSYSFRNNGLLLD